MTQTASPSMLTVDAIRSRYPAPQSILDQHHTAPGYSVGGALCLAHGLAGPASAQPSTTLLLAALCTINPALRGAPFLVGASLAEMINLCNDRRDFEAAWAYAHQALTYRS